MGEDATGADLPDGDDPGHSLTDEERQYPTVEFADGEIEPDGSFDLSTELDRDGMREIAEAIAGALSSHDLGVSAAEGTTTFGVGPRAVEASFDPDENHRGEVAITFRLSAKAMFVDDGSAETVGARGDTGFVPLSMLTDDEGTIRCYSWLYDPEPPE